MSRKRDNIAFTFSGKSAILHKVEKKAMKAGRIKAEGHEDRWYRNGQEFGEKICHPRL